MADHDGNRLAWDGVSLPLPVGWDVAGYAFRRGVTSLQLDDLNGRRATVEWMRPRRPLDRDQVSRQFREREKGLARELTREAEIHDLPAGWTATHYRGKDKASLVIAWYVGREPSLFAFLRLYFLAGDQESPPQTIRRLARGFTVHSEPVQPWRIYDMELALPRDFRLEWSSLEAGRKLLVFRWRLRRFHVWQFSLASLLLKEEAPAAWCAGYLNRMPTIKGPIFGATPEGRLTVQRARRYPFGHYDEIGRWCFRYHAGFQLEPAADRLRLWVYNYRRPADLEALPEAFR